MSYATEAEIMNMLFDRCEQAGGVRRFAAQRNISPSLITETLKGGRAVATTIAASVGFDVVTRFEPRQRGSNSL